MTKTIGDFSIDERKDLIRFVVENWMKMTAAQLAEARDVKLHVITAIVARVRRAGIPLPRKTFSSIYDEDFINELKKKFQSA